MGQDLTKWAPNGDFVLLFRGLLCGALVLR